MGTNLNRFTCVLASVAFTVPALAQDGIFVQLAGAVDDFNQPSGESAGVVVSTKGQIKVKNDTIVAAPDGSVWDLSTPAGFQKFAMQGHDMWTIVSPTGSVSDATIGQTPISGFVAISTKIDARENASSGSSGGSKVGTQITKGKVTGFLGIVGGGRNGTRFVLLPEENFYGATGTIVTSISGAGKREEVATITGTALGLFNGRLTLALVGSTETGQRVKYVIAGPEFVAKFRDVYRGVISRNDNFGFAKRP